MSVAAALLGGLFGLGAVRTSVDGAHEGGQTLAYRLLEPSEMTVPLSASGKPRPATEGENFTPNGAVLRSDAFEIVIQPGEWVEYKAVMKQGDSLVYTWQADGGELTSDFHADIPDSGTSFYTRYRRAKDDTRGGGSIVAPYAGFHGWYWKNRGQEPRSIRLDLAGFYEEVRITGK